MTNRRTFLKMGVASLAVPSALVNASSILLSGSKSASQRMVVPSLYKVVYDDRFAESREFAESLNGLGADTYPIAGDITELWYKDLYHQWERKPVPIAGLTSATSLFCLEQLARDQRLRVVFRANHNYLSDGSIQHRLYGPKTLLQQEMGLTYSPNEWTGRMAMLVSSYPTSSSPLVETIITTPATDSFYQKESLVSWVIAPK
jgi:hypothetical protein